MKTTITIFNLGSAFNHQLPILNNTMKTDFHFLKKVKESVRKPLYSH